MKFFSMVKKKGYIEDNRIFINLKDWKSTDKYIYSFELQNGIDKLRFYPI